MVATIHQLAIALALAADARGLGAVVDEALFEPGVLEGVLGRDALFGVVDEDFLQQVEELLVEGCIRGDDFLIARMSFHVAFIIRGGGGSLTLRCFIALTYFLDAREVSVLG